MPLDLWVVTNVGYFEALGDETLYAYKRKVRINSCGKIYAVTPETRVSVDVPTLCNPA